jgi:hypothetical protein
MKKMTLIALLAALAGAAFAQSQVDVAILTVGADVGNAYPGSAAKTGLLNSTKNSVVEPTVTYTYTAKLDDTNTVKAGAILDLFLPLVSGTDASYTAGQLAGKVDPFVQYQGFGVDAKFTFPIAFAGTADKAGLNAGAGGYTAFKPVSAAGKFAIASNTLAVANYEKVTYKYAIDKTTSVAVGYEADFVLVPTVFLADVLPQISAVYGPVQFDAKYSFYFTWADAIATTAGTNAASTNYLEPKLTYDLGSVGVKGLKAYVAGRASLGQTSAAGVASALVDSRVQPGVSYSTALEGVGTVGGDLSVRINRIDTNDTTKPSSSDVRLNLTYSQKF